MATTKRSFQELYEIIKDYLTQDCGGYLDPAEANIRMIASRIPNSDLNGLAFEQALRTAINAGGLIENQQIKAVTDAWFLTLPGREYTNDTANRQLLSLAFLYVTGKLNGDPITLDALNKHADKLIANGQLSKSAQAVAEERETQRAIQAGIADAKEQARMVQELLAPIRISKNPYAAGEGEKTQRQYDALQDDLFALSLEDLRNKHAVTMRKRELRNLGDTDIDALKLRVREYTKQNQSVERYAELPTEIRLDGRVTPLNKETILFVQKYNRSVWDYWTQKFGIAALAARMEEN